MYIYNIYLYKGNEEFNHVSMLCLVIVLLSDCFSESVANVRTDLVAGRLFFAASPSHLDFFKVFFTRGQHVLSNHLI